MNRFELMNEVERLRKADEVSKLQAKVNQLNHELGLAAKRIAKLEKKLEFIAWKGKKPPNLRSGEDRRKQAQGRRRADRRVVKS